MIEENTVTDADEIIKADPETIINAIEGKLRETNGKRHVIGLRPDPVTDALLVSWEVLEHDELAEASHGEDYIDVEDIAEYDCNDDAYSDEWKARITIHDEVQINRSGADERTFYVDMGLF